MKWQSSCVCVNLRRAARAVSQIYDEALAESGIKITQFSLLRAVERNERLRSAPWPRNSISIARRWRAISHRSSAIVS
jgi:hypothetical protein